MSGARLHGGRADARRCDGSSEGARGTQTGKKFRFKEMGAPDVKHRGRTGALLVEIKVQVPTNLSDDERDAMTKLREADTRDYREKVNRYKATY